MCWAYGAPPIFQFLQLEYIVPCRSVGPVENNQMLSHFISPQYPA